MSPHLPVDDEPLATLCHHHAGRRVSPDDFRAQHSDDDHTSDPEATVFLCGAYQFAGDVGSQLVEALAPILHLPHTNDDPLHDAIGLLSRELATPAPGQQTVLDRLLDIVLVHAIRASFAQSHKGHAGIKPRQTRASTRRCVPSTLTPPDHGR